MQEILRGKKCLLSINMAKVGAVQNAVKIDTHIISPSGVVSCVANGYDELKKVVALIISGDVLNEVGAYSIDLRLVFADSVIIVPTFAFAEVVEGEVPCYGVSEVYVSIEGGEVVPSGNTTTIKFVSQEEFEQLSNAVAGKVDEVEGKGLSTNDYTDAEKAKVAEIEGLKLSIASKANTNGNYPYMTVGKAQGVVGISQVQEALTLTTKANGNIVIGNLAGQSKEFVPATPSGDPLHYAYVAAGAVWNANTGYWEIYDMKDVTNEQMRRSYNFGHINTNDSAPLSMYSSSSPSYIRFNLPRTGSNAAYFSAFGSFASANYEIEVINLMATHIMSADKVERSQIVNASYAFNYCENLRRVLSFIDFSTATNVTGMFNRCFRLEQINCFGLKQDISFAYSPLLSKESLLYMINNCASGVSFTITLHPDVYDNAKDSWGTEIEDAIEGASSNKGTTITLASA